MSSAVFAPELRDGRAPTREARWLAVVSHTDPRYGGLSSAVPRLSRNLAAAGPFDVSLAAFCVPEEHFQPAQFDADHLSFWPAARRPWLQSGELRRRFQTTVAEADGVHIHGLWEASTAMASLTSRSLGKPYIVSAHGMLEPWALANKRLKKWLYATLIERRVIANASCLHALTRAEAGQYRAFGATCPIAVIPNAVDVPANLSSEAFLASQPSLRGKRLILFLGRLHPKKGLDLLAGAWPEIAKAHPDAHLVLAGPDAEGTQARVQDVLAGSGAPDSVSFTGMLDGAMKWSALAAAECFVLPSYSEGLSMGVLEALGAGVPVIVTRQCNMPEAREYEAGWEIEATVEDLGGALRSVLGRAREENARTGRRGSDLVTSRYNSRQVAAAMAEVYQYVLNGIPTRNVTLL